jgi:hypothetical protein
VVVDLPEIHDGDARIVETKRLLEAQTLVEGCRRRQVGGTECDMRDPAQRERLGTGDRCPQQAEGDLPDRIGVLSDEQSVSCRYHGDRRFSGPEVSNGAMVSHCRQHVFAAGIHGGCRD